MKNFGEVTYMANIKSAKKRARIGIERGKRNSAQRSALRTALKKFDLAVEAGNKEEAQVLLKNAVKKLDMAGSKGLLHRNNVANKKSKLMKRFNGMA